MKFNLLTIFWNCACAYIPQLVNFITPLNFLCAGCTLTLLRSAGERPVVRTLSTQIKIYFHNLKLLKDASRMRYPAIPIVSMTRARTSLGKRHTPHAWLMKANRKPMDSQSR